MTQVKHLTMTEKKNACTCFKPVIFGTDSLCYSKSRTSKHQILSILTPK